MLPSPLLLDAVLEKLVGSWHVGADASTEVSLGRVFWWRQCWRVEVRTATQETCQKDGDRPGQQGHEHGGASAGTVIGEKKRAQEEAKRRVERIQGALTQLGSGDDMKEVRDKLNRELSRAKKALWASTPRERH